VASAGDGCPELRNPAEEREMEHKRTADNRLIASTARSLHKRPTIFLRAGSLPEAVDRAEDALLGHCASLQIFQRAGELVRIVSLPERRADGGLKRPRSSVQLENLSSTALTEILNRIAKWKRKKSDRFVLIDCPAKIATSYLSRTGTWRLPALTALISAPILRNDGVVLQSPGYDTQTGLYLVSDTEAPMVPSCPTFEDAKASLQVLLRPFSEFPFVTEQDRAVHIACILTAIQRSALQACPIFGYSAPAQRSGKSLLAESVAIIATGKPAAATAVSGDREETRKMILSALREGHSIINLDNIEHPLTSPDLAKAITQPEYQDRALGTNRMLRLPTTVLWTATGNNLSFRGDLASRALVSRIDAKVESPETRNFQIPSLKHFLELERQTLVVAALTILRAYQVAGRPKQGVKPWGGFEEWSVSIREPLIWLGMADPCDTRAAVAADDPERQNSLAAIRALYEEFKDSEFTAKRIIRHCKSAKLRTAVECVAIGRHGEIDASHLGWWLRRTRDRICGGLRLEVAGKKSGSNRWKIVEVPGGQGGQSLGTCVMRFPRLKITRFPRYGDNLLQEEYPIQRFPRFL
jgi:putative DNA primase/helicase